MRRGFLNKAPKAPGRTLVALKTEQINTTPLELVTIPNLKVADPCHTAPECTTIPKGFKAYNVVTLPYPNTFPGEPAALCILYPGAKESILALPDFPTRLTFPPFFRYAFAVKDTPGTGKAMVAVIPIQAGELILNERPLILYPGAFPYHPNLTYHPDDLWHRLVQLLESPFRKIFYDLHNCKGSETDVARSKGIRDTNSISVGPLPGSYEGYYAAICPFLSRMNHSCSPNAEACWSLGSMSFSIRALRTIQPEEQITIAYCGILRSREQRQKELLSKYSFKCACWSCSLPGPESARSDIRRSLLPIAINNASSLRDDRSLKEWASDSSLPDDIINHSLKIVGMMEEERLYEEEIWTVHYARLCKAYCALGNRKAAIEWAKKGAVMMTAFTGNDGGWNKVVDAPERSEWWALRNKSVT